MHKLGACLLFALCFVASSSALAGASLIVTPRFEVLQGEEALAQRGLLRLKATGQAEPFSFYFEGYGEFEASREERRERRIESPLVLQEAYVEFKHDAFYLRAGKQAMRWSEMWVLPSLDIWTARRWNRLLYDPQADQFDHSGGVSVAWASSLLSIEGVVLSEVARDRFPRPLPEFMEERNQMDLNGGTRARMELGPVGLFFVTGRANERDTTGFGLNAAFENAVPKVELGETLRSSDGERVQKTTFIAGGLDLFLGNWTFQPQATFSQTEDLRTNQKKSHQTLLYFGMTWVEGNHEVQGQMYFNQDDEDSFANLFYAYNWKSWLQIGGFLQHYAGKPQSLFGLYEQMTGGTVMGLRLEMNQGWSKD